MNATLYTPTPQQYQSKTHVNLNADEVLRWLSYFPYPVELRILKSNKGVLSGYYDTDHRHELVNDIDSIYGNADFYGPIEAVYITLNQFKPELLARSLNRFERYVKCTTSDADIVKRGWLPFDIDPIRPAGISATDEQKEAAIQCRQDLLDHLYANGFPTPFVGDSGNGWHVLLSCSINNTPENNDLLNRFYATMAGQFTHWISDRSVKFDTTVWNAARIWKLYGTKACKGDELPDQHIRHRMAALVSVPDEPEDATLEQIRDYLAEHVTKPTTTVSLSSTVAPPISRATSTTFDLEGFLTKHNIGTSSVKQEADRTRHILEECPFDPSHNRGEVAVYQFNDGKLGFHCFHESCKAKHWRDVRLLYEPDAYDTKHDEDGKPTIRVNGQYLDVKVDAAKEAIRQANTPIRWVNYGGVFGRLQLTQEGASVKPLERGGMLDLMSRSARWVSVKATKDGDHTETPTDPPAMVGDVLRDNPDFLPRLTRIVETPCFVGNGRLLDAPGYDDDTGTYYYPASLVVPSVATSPTADDITEAKRLLIDEVLGDFPFDSEASRCHAVALFLLPFVRAMIDGPTPLHMIGATTEGTGKGLLTECFSIITTGRDGEAETAGHDDAEWRKKITAQLLKGAPYVWFDNVNVALNSQALASVSTDRVWRDRLLGKSETVSLPINATWVFTGNNIHSSQEMARRFVSIRLDANLERPYEGRTFKHPNLTRWAKEHRGELVWACLTLVRAWMAAGSPLGQSIMASFEHWSQVIGGILDVAGIGGFLANRGNTLETMNTTEYEWSGFVGRWWELHQDKPLTVRELTAIATSDGDVGWLPSLFDDDRKKPSSVLAQKLGLKVGRVYGDRKITAAPEGNKRATAYRLVPVDVVATSA